MEYVVDAAIQLPQLNPVRLPEGIDDVASRQLLLNKLGLEIGAGLGDWAGQVWRIGLMGHTCQQRNVIFLLKALGDLLHKPEAGVNAAEAYYAQAHVG